ncbi:MAG TPA: hypothetical protein VMM56_11730 [Planctomycetaceae bacterium]|nr:hypothetical protein [Planctomycetaceae bacterium]
MKLCSLCFLLFLPVTLQAATYNVSIEPEPGEAFGSADYRLWVPDEVATLRGVIVRQHGCGEGARKFGREHADDPQWQALARKWDCALLGSQLWAPEEDCSTWTIPEDGSARAFLSGLRELAERSNHPELTRVPWCLWGHSGGAMWVCNMTYRYPERVIATFPRSGGLAPTGREFKRSQPAQFGDSPKAIEVPILFCFGEQEDIEGTRFYAGVSAARELFEYGRSKDAPWSLAVHPGSEHENSNSRLLAIRFFDACLKQRLPDAQSRGEGPIAPLAVSREKSWFGDLKSLKIIRERDGVKDASGMVWLPDTTLARAWREFCERGSLSDSSPPPAPERVAIEETDEGIKITWSGEADIESGLGSFRVYRDGQMIGEIRGPEDKRWNPHQHYHAWNYSDQPLWGTEFPPKEFLDTTTKLARGVVYEISTVNQAGLESARAGAAE